MKAQLRPRRGLTRCLFRCLLVLSSLGCGGARSPDATATSQATTRAPSLDTSAAHPDPEPVSSSRPWRGAPYVLRCRDRFTGCEIAARVHRETGASEPFPALPTFRDPKPVLLDDEHLYVPGRALTKAGLDEVELDWRGGGIRAMRQGREALLVVDAAGAYLLPKDGSPRHDLVDGGQFWSGAIGSVMAWVESRLPDRLLVVATLEGREIRRITDGAPRRPHADGGDLYWVADNDEAASDRIMQLHDGRITVFAETMAHPVALAFDEGFVYWVTSAPEGRVLWRAPKAGGEPERLSVSHGLRGSRGNEDHLEIHGGHAYWNAAQSVVRAPKEGGPAQILATVDFHGDIHNFAIDRDHLYVTAEIYRTRRSQ